MNQRIWNGITVTLITTAIGTATSSYAQQTQAVDQDSQGSPPAAQVGKVSATATLTSAQPVQPPEVVKVGEFQSKAATAAQQEEVIAKIDTYESAGHQTVTLYVRGIPVLTFLGSH